MTDATAAGPLVVVSGHGPLPADTLAALRETLPFQSGPALLIAPEAALRAAALPDRLVAVPAERLPGGVQALAAPPALRRLELLAALWRATSFRNAFLAAEGLVTAIDCAHIGPNLSAQTALALACNDQDDEPGLIFLRDAADLDRLTAALAGQGHPREADGWRAARPADALIWPHAAAQAGFGAIIDPGDGDGAGRRLLLRRDAMGRPAPFFDTGTNLLPVGAIRLARLDAWGAPETVRDIGLDDIITGERIERLCGLTLIAGHAMPFHAHLAHHPRHRWLQFDDATTDEIAAAVAATDLLFVTAESLADFVRLILPGIRRRFVLVTHNGDKGVTAAALPLLDDDRIAAWFAQNAQVTHPKLTCLPIGVANRQWPHGDLAALTAAATIAPKSPSVFLNYNPVTNESERMMVAHHLLPRDFVRYGPPEDYPVYIQSLSRHQFCAAPHGNGVDTHRTWESLYVGTIPLVTRDGWSAQFADLPLIEIDDWSAVTLPALRAQAETLADRPHHLAKLTLRHWRGRIRAAVRSSGV